MSLASDLQTAHGTVRRLMCRIDGIKDALWQDIRVPGFESEDVGDLCPGAHPWTEDLVALWRCDEYGATAAMVDEMGRFNATVSGSPAVTDGQFHKCRVFGTTAKYAEVTTDSRWDLQTFTLSLWIYVNSTTQPSGGKIWYRQREAGGGYSFTLNFSGGDSTPAASLYFTDTATITATGSQLATGWHHVAVTWNGAALYLFVDGAIAASASAAKTILYTSGQNIGIGRSLVTNTLYADVYLDDIAVYPTAQSSEWVRRLYVGGLYWTRPGLVCLQPRTEISAGGLDLRTLKTTLSALTLELANIPKPSDPTKRLFAELFAPGRWTQGRWTYLRRADTTDKYLESESSTIYVQDTDAESWPSSGEAHLGAEVLSYTGTGSSTDPGAGAINTLTGVTRGLYPCISRYQTGVWAPTIRHPIYDALAGDVGHNLIISQYPYGIVGRRVAVYLTAWDRENHRWHKEDDAILIWAGRISDGVYYDAQRDTWQLSCESVFEELKRPVPEKIPTVKLAEVNLLGTSHGSGGLKCQIREDASTGFSADTIISFPAGRYLNADAVAKALQDTLNAATWDGSHSTTAWEITRDGDGFDIKCVIENPANAPRDFIFEPSGFGGVFHPLQVLGFDSKIKVTAPYGTQYGHLISDAAYDVYHPIQVGHNGGELIVGNTDALWSDQGTFGSTVVSYLFAKKAYVNGNRGAKGLYLVAVGAASSNGLDIVETAQVRDYPVANGFVGVRRGSEDSADLSQGYVISAADENYKVRGPFELLLYPLLSTGSAGYNHATYDQMPQECAVGIDAQLVDINSFLAADRDVLARAESLAIRRDYLIQKPVAWFTLLERECKLFGYSLCWDRGKLRLKTPYRRDNMLYVTTVDESNAKRSAQVALSTETVVNHFTFKYDYNADEDKFGPEVIVTDVNSRTTTSITGEREIEHPGIDKRLITQPIVQLVELVLMRNQNLLRFPSQIVELTLAPTLINRIAVGDVVLYESDTQHPNPFGNGTMAVSALALVLDYSLSLETYLARCKLAIFPHYDLQLIRPWAPSALVNKRASNGGWDAANARFTLVATQWGPGTHDDGAAFASGDKIRVIARTPQNAESLVSWENFGVLTVASAYETDGANLLTVSNVTLTGWNTDMEYVIVPADYDEVVSAQKTNATFQANAVTGKLGTDGPHHYG